MPPVRSRMLPPYDMSYLVITGRIFLSNAGKGGPGLRGTLPEAWSCLTSLWMMYAPHGHSMICEISIFIVRLSDLSGSADDLLWLACRFWHVSAHHFQDTEGQRPFRNYAASLECIIKHKNDVCLRPQHDCMFAVLCCLRLSY